MKMLLLLALVITGGVVLADASLSVCEVIQQQEKEIEALEAVVFILNEVLAQGCNCSETPPPPPDPPLVPLDAPCEQNVNCFFGSCVGPSYCLCLEASPFGGCDCNQFGVRPTTTVAECEFVQ